MSLAAFVTAGLTVVEQAWCNVG